MKLAIIGPSEKYASGISNYTWRLGTELSARPILFNNMLPRSIFPGKTRVGKADTKIYHASPTYTDWYNPLSWIRAVREIRRGDLFIVEWWSSSVAHMLLFICLLAGRRFVIEAHEVLDPMEQKSFLLSAYARLCRYILFHKASAIVVHNQHDLSLIRDTYKKVSVIPHAVYDQFKKGERIQDGKFNILFFGLIREYKGIDVLLKAFNNFNVPDKQLFIIGENWDHIPIPKQENITYVNKYVSDDDIEQYFSQADVLVMPYTRGSASGVAAIGMHYGLPIISSRVEGIYEQLFDYDGSFWIDSGDDQALTNWLYTIYCCPRGTYEVPERLTWLNVKGKWEELMEEVCRRT